MQTAADVTPTRPTAPETHTTVYGDWDTVMHALDRGDPEAIERLTRAIQAVLRRCGAGDFRAEWEDLVQDVLLAVLVAIREGRVREPAVFIGYVKRTTRNKWHDRLRRHVRRREDANAPAGDLEGEDALRVSTGRPPTEVRLDVRRALDALPRHMADAVFKVYAEGKSYEQAARETGTPFGSLKRYLREGMELLRAELATVRA